MSFSTSPTTAKNEPPSIVQETWLAYQGEDAINKTVVAHDPTSFAFSYHHEEPHLRNVNVGASYPTARSGRIHHSAPASQMMSTGETTTPLIFISEVKKKEWLNTDQEGGINVEAAPFGVLTNVATGEPHLHGMSMPPANQMTLSSSSLIQTRRGTASAQELAEALQDQTVINKESARSDVPFNQANLAVGDPYSHGIPNLDDVCYPTANSEISHHGMIYPATRVVTPPTLAQESAPQWPLSHHQEETILSKEAAGVVLRHLTSVDDIEEPHPHDILKGKGRKISSHIGNVRFRSLVKSLKLKYALAPKEEKPFFAKHVIESISTWNPPGRFLAFNKETNIWEEMTKRKAMDKTRQALREGAPKTLRKHSERNYSQTRHKW